MKKNKKIIISIAIVVAVVLIIFMFIGPLPTYNKKYVENYISKYSKDFTYLRKDSYSSGIDGFIESHETDWYFHDNELDFDFHVKTLKSEYPPKGKHIACNYYDYYVEKLLDIKSDELNQIINDTFMEIYELENVSIKYSHDTGQIRISFDGKENINYTKTRDSELCEEATKKIIEVIKKYDSNFKNRSMKVGWDVDLNTDWSNTNNNLSIMVNGTILSIINN